MKITKYPFVFLLIIIWGLICCVGDVYGANSGSQVKKFIKTVQKKDFKTIFELTYSYQQRVSDIKSNKPKVLWDKLISEYYERQKDAVFKEQELSSWFLTSGMGATNSIRALINLLNPPNEWKITETRGNEVYVSLKYPNVEESPLIGNKFLKETILDFYISESGLYMWSNRVTEGDIYWEIVPLRVFSVRWHAGQIGGLFVEINGIGGSPPYSSTTKCGNCILENLGSASKHKLDYDCIHINVGRGQWMGLKNCIEESGMPFPLKFKVTLTDKSGQQDTAFFEVPKVFGAYCWVANPWCEWGQGRPHMCYKPMLLKNKKEVKIEMEIKRKELELSLMHSDIIEIIAFFKVKEKQIETNELKLMETLLKANIEIFNTQYSLFNRDIQKSLAHLGSSINYLKTAISFADNELNEKIEALRKRLTSMKEIIKVNSSKAQEESDEIYQEINNLINIKIKKIKQKIINEYSKEKDLREKGETNKLKPMSMLLKVKGEIISCKIDVARNNIEKSLKHLDSST